MSANLVSSLGIAALAITSGAFFAAWLMDHGIIRPIGVFVLVTAVNFLTAHYLLPICSERHPRK